MSFDSRLNFGGRFLRPECMTMNQRETTKSWLIHFKASFFLWVIIIFKNKRALNLKPQVYILTSTLKNKTLQQIRPNRGHEESCLAFWFSLSFLRITFFSSTPLAGKIQSKNPLKPTNGPLYLKCQFWFGNDQRWVSEWVHC